MSKTLWNVQSFNTMYRFPEILVTFILNGKRIITLCTRTLKLFSCIQYSLIQHQVCYTIFSNWPELGKLIAKRKNFWKKSPVTGMHASNSLVVRYASRYLPREESLAFGNKLSMELMFLDAKEVLPIVDTATHFSAATFWDAHGAYYGQSPGAVCPAFLKN